MKKIFIFKLALLFSIQLTAQVVITESFGWLEAGYVKWAPDSNAESYNVYYSGEGITNKKIDNEQIRSYGSYFRADIKGLKTGSYTFTVKAVIGGVEGTGATTNTINVLPHDRTGFAFANGRVPGAYKADGTPKANAVIIYITEKIKNTVSLNVAGASSNPCIGLQNILDGFKKGSDTRPLIIRLVGQITDFDYMLSGDIVIENKNNSNSYITLEGVGDDTVADGWGIRIKNASNIEIRNIASMNVNSSEGDNIGLQQNNDYIWVHNVDFFYGDAGTDSDQAKGDGALDCKKSTYVTFSYNHFWDSGKSNLLGLSEATTSGLYITYHHNWYDHSDSRHPRVRYYSAHVYNNYYDGNSKYGIGSTMGSSVFSEGNYFRNCKYPMQTSMQGTDIFNPNSGQNDPNNYATFSKEDGGAIKAFNNYIIGATRFVPYGDANPAYNTTFINSISDFDAFVASTRNEIIPSSIISKQGGNSYNNFDTDASLYVKNFTPESPEVAKTNVITFSGRVNGGDFKWTFNNVIDDASSTVNIPLKNALANYKTSLVYIQGESVVSSHFLEVTSGNSSQNVIEGNAIDPIIFTWGGTATDVNIDGIPSSGIVFSKDINAKTVTISGTPTAEVSYNIWTIGATGNLINKSGIISISPIGTNEGDEIHNFTVSSLSSDFYTITGNLSNSKGTIIYDDLTLTQCLKMESSNGIVNFTTNQTATLTLVMNASATNATAYANIDGINYTSDSGIIKITIPSGNHVIKKSSTANLFYIKTTFETLGITDNFEKSKITLYPNPVKDLFQIITQQQIEMIQIYNTLGILVKTIKNNFKNIDVSNLSSGSYFVRLKSNEGSTQKIIIKQ